MQKCPWVTIKKKDPSFTSHPKVTSKGQALGPSGSCAVRPEARCQVGRAGVRRRLPRVRHPRASCLGPNPPRANPERLSGRELLPRAKPCARGQSAGFRQEAGVTELVWPSFRGDGTRSSSHRPPVTPGSTLASCFPAATACGFGGGLACRKLVRGRTSNADGARAAGHRTGGSLHGRSPARPLPVLLSVDTGKSGLCEVEQFA